MSTPQWFAEFERSEAQRLDRIDQIKSDLSRWDKVLRWQPVRTKRQTKLYVPKPVPQLDKEFDE